MPCNAIALQSARVKGGQMIIKIPVVAAQALREKYGESPRLSSTVRGVFFDFTGFSIFVGDEVKVTSWSSSVSPDEVAEFVSAIDALLFRQAVLSFLLSAQGAQIEESIELPDGTLALKVSL